MVEIPDSLRSLFSATLQRRDGRYVLEVPANEVDKEAVAAGETYRVAVLEGPSDQASTSQEESRGTRSSRTETNPAQQGPPVDEGEVRDVTIETVGDQGDGIAKVERGYVVIVPDARPGDAPTVEIEEVKENVAFARVVDHE